jgi:hypothetical protein
LHGHGLERDRGRQTLAPGDDEQHGAARWEVQHPGDPEGDLDRDQGTEPGEAETEEECEGQRRGDVQDLHRDHQAHPREPIREHARERAERHHGDGAAERGHADHQRRIGEGERQPAEHDHIHPARRAGTEPRQPEESVAPVQ